MTPYKQALCECGKEQLPLNLQQNQTQQGQASAATGHVLVFETI